MNYTQRLDTYRADRRRGRAGVNLTPKQRRRLLRKALGAVGLGTLDRDNHRMNEGDISHG